MREREGRLSGLVCVSAWACVSCLAAPSQLAQAQPHHSVWQSPWWGQHSTQSQSVRYNIIQDHLSILSVVDHQSSGDSWTPWGGGRSYWGWRQPSCWVPLSQIGGEKYDLTPHSLSLSLSLFKSFQWVTCQLNTKVYNLHKAKKLCSYFKESKVLFKYSNIYVHINRHDVIQRSLYLCFLQLKTAEWSLMVARPGQARPSPSTFILFICLGR